MRAELIAAGADDPAARARGGRSRRGAERAAAEVAELVGRLTADVPADPRERSARAAGSLAPGEHARLAPPGGEGGVVGVLPTRGAAGGRPVDERCALSGLEFVGRVGGTAKAPVHRYRFPPQEIELRGGETCAVGGAKLGEVEAISLEDRTVDIKKRRTPQRASGCRVRTRLIGTDVMRTRSAADRRARRRARHRRRRAASGPPGTCCCGDRRGSAPNRSHRPARRARRVGGPDRAAARGRRAADPGTARRGQDLHRRAYDLRAGAGRQAVGITANSHKVIRNLLDEVVEAADETAHRRSVHPEGDRRGRTTISRIRVRDADNAEVLAGARQRPVRSPRARRGCGRAQDAVEAVDVLFVDEAAQMSLANVLAVSQAAAQTSCCSAIRSSSSSRCRAAIRKGRTSRRSITSARRRTTTIPADRGLFLDETWRLHPDICAFTSELFYEGRLQSRAGLERQMHRRSTAAFAGTGLQVSAGRARGQSEHLARGSRADRAIWSTRSWTHGATWIDRDGERAAARARRHPDHRALQRAGLRAAGAAAGRAGRHRRQVPGAGSADRDLLDDHVEPRRRAARHGVSLQPEPAERRDLAREMRVHPGRLTRAVRARCRTPRQMRLANAFCRYLELATTR